MRAFGSLRIASIVAILSLSLVECMPNKDNLKTDDYLDDGEYDEDSINGNDDDDPTQPADAGPTGPLTVRSRNSTLTANPGDTVEFPCIVENAEDTPISWSRDKEFIFVGELSMLSDTRFSRANNFSLILRNVTESDAAYQYSCQIVDESPIEISHKLVVVEKPPELINVIRVNPARRVEINENESVTFGCETSIEPKPRMIWSHKGERLHNGEEIVNGGNFIMIKEATRHHAGRYQCLAENGSDKPPQDAIEVVVRYKPEIEVEHEVVHTGTGTRSELTCIVHAHPHAKVTWHKNQKLIGEKSGRKSLIDDKSRRTLVIEHTTQHDLGQYTCTAKNQFGEASKVIELTGAPSRPRFHGGEIADDESSIILKWHVESYAPITEYKLEYRRKGDTAWKTLSPRVTNGRGNQFMVEHVLERLEPGTYETKLMAKNEYGWSQHSNLHTFREEYRSGEPENVTDSAITFRPFVTLMAFLVFVVSYGSMHL